MNIFRDIFEMLKETFFDWPIVIIIGVIVSVALAIILFFVLHFSVRLVDSSLLPSEQGIGRIVCKEFVPGHTDITMIDTGQGAIPITQEIQDSWQLTVAVKGEQDRISVSQNFFNSIMVGAQVNVQLVHGRLSGRVYIKEISCPGVPCV